MSVHLSYDQLSFLPKYYKKEKDDFGSAVFNLMKNYDLFLSFFFHRYQLNNKSNALEIRNILLIYATLFDIDRLKKTIENYEDYSQTKLYSVDIWTMYEASKLMMKIASMIANTPRIYEEDISIYEMLNRFDEAVENNRIVGYKGDIVKLVDFGNLKLKNVHLTSEHRHTNVACPICGKSKSKNSSMITHVLGKHVNGQVNNDGNIRYDTLFRFMTKCAIVFKLQKHSINDYFNFFMRACKELKYGDLMKVRLSEIESFIEEDEPSQDLFDRGRKLPGSFESNQK